MTVPAVIVLAEGRSTGGTGDWEASVTQFAVCARYEQIPQFIGIRPHCRAHRNGAIFSDLDWP